MTVSDLIRFSMRAIGVLAASEVPSADELNDAFAILNAMLDSWASENLTIYATMRAPYTLQVGLQPHTIGLGGTFNTVRPVRIDRASIIPVSSPGTERPLWIMSDAEWQDQQAKTAGGISLLLWPQMEYPLIKLFLWPIPSQADTLMLYTPEQITRFPATSTTFDLPPGYERGLKWALAKELAPEFGVTLSGEAADNAAQAVANIKRLNHRASYLKADPAILPGGGRFNLIAGDR